MDGHTSYIKHPTSIHPSNIIHLMFNKERFHNALALSLGYERIVKDKRISIEVDDSDDPWVTLKIQGCPGVIRFKSSDSSNVSNLKDMPAMQDDIKIIADAVRQAYIEASKAY